MKFVYVGDSNDPKEALEDKTAFGILFPIGEPVEVTDEAIIAKLKGNSHFMSEEEAEKSAAPARRAAKATRSSRTSDE
jgi:hypothetical protein